MDDINKMMSNAGKRTRDMAGSAKLNSAIADEEKKLSSLYFQIGKLYVNLHPTDYEQDFSGFMAQIAESEAKLSNYRQQLQLIKGVVSCSRCSAEVAINAAFCSACGNAMPNLQNNFEFERCAFCNNNVAKGQRFCTYCGKPMATQAVAAPVQQQDTVIGTCMNCGSMLYANSGFCTNCGTPITTGFVQQQFVAPQQQFVAPQQQTVSTQQEYTEPQQTAEPQQQFAEAVGFCTNCGSKIYADCDFCTECGTRVAE